MTSVAAASIFNVLSTMFEPGPTAGGKCCEGLKHGAGPDGTVTHLVVSYSSDFGELWRLGAGFVDWLAKGEKTIVLVWDSTPGNGPGGVPLGQLLTPFDWAAAVSLRFEASDESWRLVILDLVSAGDEGCHAVKDFRMFRQGLTTLLPHVSICRRQDVDQLLSMVFAPRHAGAKTDKDFLRRLWLDGLTRESRQEGRHALANIIGPMLLLPELSGNLPETYRVNAQAQALLSLLQVLGVAKPAGGLDPGREPLKDDRGGGHQRGARGEFPVPWWTAEKVRGILVDDMFELGWREVLAAALGAKPEDIETYGTPAELSGFCKGLVTEAGHLRMGGSIHKEGIFSNPNLVLFLDLRLFQPHQRKEEASFVKVLLSLAREAQEDGPNAESLKWPGFSDAELSAVQTWLVDPGQDQHSGRLTALSLLPRLIALVDPFLPIVLFSSTGNRALVKPFEPYGTIITDFEKPRLWGNDPNEAARLGLSGLSRALARAEALVDARRLCYNVFRLGSVAYKTAPFRGMNHLELYVDESGKAGRAGDRDAAKGGIERNRFVISGLLVGYSDCKSGDEGPARLTREMEKPKEIVRKQDKASGKTTTIVLRWWPANEGDPYLFKGRDARKQPLSGAIENVAIDDVAKAFLDVSNGLPLMGLCVEYADSQPVGQGDDFSKEWHADNRYRVLLRTLLELFLFDLLPVLDMKQGTSISIFVATRKRDASEFESGNEAIVDLARRYGFYGAPTYLRTFDEASLRPLVFEVLALRPKDTLNVAMDSVRGFTLLDAHQVRNWDKESGASKLVKNITPKGGVPRHQHYMADILANACREHGKEVQNLEPWEQFFGSGLYDVRDAYLESLLQAERAVSRGERAGGLARLGSVEFPAVSRGASGASLAARRLGIEVEQLLSGEEFLQVAAGLGERLSGKITKVDFASREGVIRYERRGREEFCSFDLLRWASAAIPVLGMDVLFRETGGLRKDRAIRLPGGDIRLLHGVAYWVRPKSVPA